MRSTAHFEWRGFCFAWQARQKVRHGDRGGRSGRSSRRVVALALTLALTVALAAFTRVAVVPTVPRGSVSCGSRDGRGCCG